MKKGVPNYDIKENVKSLDINPEISSISKARLTIDSLRNPYPGYGDDKIIIEILKNRKR